MDSDEVAEINAEIAIMSRQIENFNRKMSRRKMNLTDDQIDSIQRQIALARSSIEQLRAIINSKRQVILNG